MIKSKVSRFTLAMLLSVCLVFTMVPSIAWAAGDTPDETDMPAVEQQAEESDDEAAEEKGFSPEAAGENGEAGEPIWDGEQMDGDGDYYAFEEQGINATLDTAAVGAVNRVEWKVSEAPDSAEFDYEGFDYDANNGGITFTAEQLQVLRDEDITHFFITAEIYDADNKLLKKTSKDVFLLESQIGDFFDLDGEEILIGNEVYINEEEEIFVRNSDHPQGEDVEVQVTNVTVEGEAFELTKADTVWTFKAVKEGESTVTIDFILDGKPMTNEEKIAANLGMWIDGVNTCYFTQNSHKLTVKLDNAAAYENLNYTWECLDRNDNPIEGFEPAFTGNSNQIMTLDAADIKAVEDDGERLVTIKIEATDGDEFLGFYEYFLMFEYPFYSFFRDTTLVVGGEGNTIFVDGDEWGPNEIFDPVFPDGSPELTITNVTTANKAIASVTKKTGPERWIVKGVKKGKTTITVSYKYKEDEIWKTGNVKIPVNVVNERYYSHVSIDTNDQAIVPDQTVDVKLQVFYETAGQWWEYPEDGLDVEISCTPDMDAEELFTVKRDKHDDNVWNVTGKNTFNPDTGTSIFGSGTLDFQVKKDGEVVAEAFCWLELKEEVYRLAANPGFSHVTAGQTFLVEDMFTLKRFTADDPEGRSKAEFGDDELEALGENSPFNMDFAEYRVDFEEEEPYIYDPGTKIITIKENREGDRAYVHAVACFGEEHHDGEMGEPFYDQEYDGWYEFIVGECENHKLNFVDLKRATFEADGNIKHFKCNECNNLYKDSKGFFVTNEENIVIPKIAEVRLEYDECIYTGEECKPAVTVTDRNGKIIKNNFYDVEYAENTVDPGIVNVKVTFKGNYEGDKNKQYTIKKVPLKVKMKNKSRNYGEANPEFNPEVDAVYEGFINGEGKENLGGDLVIACDADANSDAGKYDITGAGLIDNTNHYDIEYVKGTLTINKIPQPDMRVSAPDAGNKVKGRTVVNNKGLCRIQVDGVLGDAALKYKSSNTRSATVDAAGLVRATGKRSATVTITVTAAETTNYKATSKTIKVWVPKKITYAKLKKTSYTYNGKAFKPSATVKSNKTRLKRNYYRIAYANNIDAGKATATIRGDGSRYYGEIVRTFTIKKGKLAVTLKPKKTYLNVGEEININAAPADSLSPFVYKSSNEAVASIDANGLITPKKFGKFTVTVTTAASANSTATKVTRAMQVVPKSAGNLALVAGAKSFTANWTVSDDCQGYQVRYSLRSNMSRAKTVRIADPVATNTVVKGLKAKKRYYVQIRTYAPGDDGATYYSPWSGKKNVRTR